MLKLISYILTFMAGGTITLFLHCALILAKESDKNIEDKNND